MINTSYPRRKFIQRLGYTTLAIPGIALMATSALAEPLAANETSSKEKTADTDELKKTLGVALVGLGNYSTNQLAPALQETGKCKLRGIVTGSPDKAKKWKEKYDLPEENIYNYENFDSIKDNPEIDIVYVVLPNAMHAEYTIRAARAGKHVICEKPMAITPKECEDMIRACNAAKRQLSIGYRLHFEPHNQTMVEYRKERTFGPIKKIIAQDGMNIEPNVWRLNKQLAGGGPLMDVGIYCVQGAIYTSGELPVSVTAQEGTKTDLSRFREVEQSLTWQMQFKSGLVVECETAYDRELNLLRAETETGWAKLEPAYEYKGIKGDTSAGPFKFRPVNQQALQMDDFATCIIQKKKSKVSGEMGLRDVKILQGIYEAARTGEKVMLKLS